MGVAMKGVGGVVRMGKVTIVVKTAVCLGMRILDRLGEGLIGYIT